MTSSVLSPTAVDTVGRRSILKEFVLLSVAKTEDLWAKAASSTRNFKRLKMG